VETPGNILWEIVSASVMMGLYNVVVVFANSIVQALIGVRAPIIHKCLESSFQLRSIGAVDGPPVISCYASTFPVGLEAAMPYMDMGLVMIGQNGGRYSNAQQEVLPKCHTDDEKVDFE